jgi:hypothetical protein
VEGRDGRRLYRIAERLEHDEQRRQLRALLVGKARRTPRAWWDR